MVQSDRSSPAGRPRAPKRERATEGGRRAASPPAGTSIGQFQALIRQKYHATDAARGVPGTFMWFVEEVGELATALQENAPGRSPSEEERMNLEEEFADVLAWLMTLANISGAEGRGVDMERAIRKYTMEGRVEGVKQ